LVNELYQAMDGQSVDYTKFFRSAADALRGDEQSLFELFEDATRFKQWFEKWKDEEPAPKENGPYVTFCGT